MTSVLSLIVPVYNEEKNIGPLVARLKQVLTSIPRLNFEIIFCLDPCKDRTEEVIAEERQKDPRIKLIKFARRVGQPAAILGGIHYCTGDACVVIDADLQDPPELISEMVTKWREGFDVVYAKRKNRDYENFSRKILGHAYYKVLSMISDVSIPRNTGDFRLTSRRVIDELKKLKEGHAFLRGMVSYVGFKQVPIVYERHARLEGETKYPALTGSIKIALNGIFAYANNLTRGSAVLGFFGLGFGSVLLLLKAFVAMGFFESSFLESVGFWHLAGTFALGFQFLFMGIVGEYAYRTYEETMWRPLFIVDRTLGFEEVQKTSTFEPRPDPATFN